MKALDAIRMASKDNNVIKLVEDGFFLVSAFASYVDKPIDEWLILYMSPDKKKVRDCTAKKDAIILGEETPAVSESKILVTDGIEFDENYALEKALAEFKKKPMNSLITLHNRDGVTTWSINFIMQDMSVTLYCVDAITGEIYHTKTVSMIRRL